MVVMSRYLIRCFVSIQNTMLAVMLWLSVHAMTATYVSGNLIAMQSCPLDVAWLAWSRIRVSASSYCAHNSSTLLQSIPFSPAVSLWHSIPWVTKSEPKSANITKYSGLCHSCARKDAIFALLLPSLRYFLPLGGTLLIAMIDSYLNANACTTPFSLWVLDGYIRMLTHDQVSPGPVLGCRRFHEREDIYWLDYWMSLVHLSWNAI